MTSERYDAERLRAVARAIFVAAGLDEGKAAAIAYHLVDADLMGHDTHGLALLPGYVREIRSGSMTAAGEPRVVSDRGACVVWDGRRLPGVWLLDSAVRAAVERAPTYGTATVVVSRSHHCACLATFLPLATAAGMMIVIASSDPSNATVAPFGGRRAVYSPDPIAVGIPASGDPILVDASASITTNGMVNRLAAEGRRLPAAWLLDGEGNPTDDPAAYGQGGTILPTGGIDHGQKGYGLALMIESLTQALSGYGRADRPTDWGASFYVQVIDPTAFGGQAAFVRQTDWLVDACRTTPPRPGVASVRLPGQAGLARRREAEAHGVALYPGVADAVRAMAAELDVSARLG